MNSLKQAEEDRLSLESQLRQARKLESLGVMAGGIAHDFNNLLMGISGNVELAERKLPEASPVASHLELIREISNLAAELCGQLLAYSGKVQLDIRLLSLNETVRGVLNLIALRVPASIKISSSLADELPMVEADPTQLQQLLMNLMINAIEAIGDASGEITLSTECRRLQDHDFLEFDVGIELPASVKTLADKTLNIREGDQSTTLPGKILIIDDESYVRDVAAECLIELGFDTLTASGGTEGIAKFAANQVEIIAVLLDLSMPEMDGETCYERLMELDANISVIIMSGFHEKDVSRRFEGRDRLHFLQKPFKIAQLQEAVQAVL